MPILKNARYEIFALAIARGESAHTAYTLAGYKQHRQNAIRLMTDDVLKRVREIQRAAARATTLTIQEKREFFARLVQARRSEFPADSDLWQEFRITVVRPTRKLLDKFKAIALDNDLSDEGNKPNDEKPVLVVRIGGPYDGEDIT
jgi:hypothetical protein